MKTCVYRVFDAQGDLLYVGMGARPSDRIAHHRKHKPWSGEIERYEVVELAGRDLAYAHERAVIAAENPRHNVMRKGFSTHPGRRRRRAEYLARRQAREEGKVA